MRLSCKRATLSQWLPTTIACWALGCLQTLAGESAVPLFSVDQLQPFVAKYCADCHSGDEAEAQLALDRYADLDAILKDRDRWEKVRDYVQMGLMPPEDVPRPNGPEVTAFCDWLTGELEKADAAEPNNPGRVTMRRLNRVEYYNTIHDLMGIDFEPANDFPADEVGYGFDNIGDVLALPPTLLEKYLAAAEQITERAILTEPPKPPLASFDPGDCEATGGADKSGSISSSGELAAMLPSAQEGEYAIRITAFGDQAGDEPVRMEVRVDGKPVRVIDVSAVEDQPEVYEARARLTVGDRRISTAFVNDYYQPDDPDPGNRDRNLTVLRFEVEGPLDRPLEFPETHRRILFKTPAPLADAAEHDACAREVLARFASRAYRRPATPEEVERLVALVRLARESGDSFEHGVQVAVQAILVSPHFLYRVELNDNAAPGQPYEINDYELASRMSYFLWSSLPDEELTQLAAAGKLRDPAVREAQTRRMLADAKSAALVDNFASQWLQIRNLDTVSPDPKLFPSFDPKMRAAMRQETLLFFDSIVREDRSVLDLIAADYTFVNEQLARHYGIEGVTGEEFRKVSSAQQHRGGVLTQGSVLTVTSDPTRTSPVKRGKWVLGQILGAPPPPPPPGVGELKIDPKVDTSASLRAQFEQHRADASCAACHRQMDPLGFGLENYNAIGAWREKEGDTPVDASGQMPGGATFSGPTGLQQVLLARADQFRSTLASKLLTYALGRGVERYDRRAIERIRAALVADADKFSRLVVEIVASDPFRMRRAPDAANESHVTGG